MSAPMWQVMHHPVAGGQTEVPNDPDVLAGMAGRGWVEGPDPDAPVEDEDVGEVGDAPALDFDPALLTIPQVLEAVGQDPALAALALAAELAGANRTTLTPQLEALAAGTTTGPEA